MIGAGNVTYLSLVPQEYNAASVLFKHSNNVCARSLHLTIEKLLKHQLCELRGINQIKGHSLINLVSKLEECSDINTDVLFKSIVVFEGIYFNVTYPGSSAIFISDSTITEMLRETKRIIEFFGYDFDGEVDNPQEHKIKEFLDIKSKKPRKRTKMKNKSNVF